jgi:hypothetical protein
VIASNNYLSVYRGVLTIKERYAWDGPSGIPDSADLMLPSLVHDALYQLMRGEAISKSYQKMADKLFKKMYKSEAIRLLREKRKPTLIDRLMINIWANTIYKAVRTFGKGALKK